MLRRGEDGQIPLTLCNSRHTNHNMWSHREGELGCIQISVYGCRKWVGTMYFLGNKGNEIAIVSKGAVA